MNDISNAYNIDKFNKKFTKINMKRMKRMTYQMHILTNSTRTLDQR